MELTIEKGISFEFGKLIMAIFHKFMTAIRFADTVPFRRTAIEKADINTRAERYLSVYGNAILRLAYSYVHNMEDAEDILQETLIRVLKNSPDFTNENHEKGYLLRTASNIAKNHIQYNKIRETDEVTCSHHLNLTILKWGLSARLPFRAKLKQAIPACPAVLFFIRIRIFSCAVRHILYKVFFLLPGY